MNAIYNGAEG